MARGVNKVILIGSLGKDPELRHFPNGDAVANVSIATSESWNDKQTGEKKEHTEWHNLVFRKKAAEIAAQYLKKGSKVYIEGSLRTRKYQGKDGAERYITEIIVQDMQMLDGKPNSQQSGGGTPATGAPGRASNSPGSRSSAPAETEFEDDSIPF